MRRPLTDDEQTKAVAALKAEFQKIAARELKQYGKLMARVASDFDGGANAKFLIFGSEISTQIFVSSGQLYLLGKQFLEDRERRRAKIFGDAQVSADDEKSIYGDVYLEARHDAIEAAKAALSPDTPEQPGEKPLYEGKTINPPPKTR